MECILCRMGRVHATCKNTTTSVQPTKEPKSQEISSYWNTPTNRPEDNWSDDKGTKFTGTFGSTSKALSW